MALAPDGIFLSNGPGDPEPCGYAIEAIKAFLEASIPMFGICLGTPATRACRRRKDAEDGTRSSWREPSGARSKDGRGHDYQPESWILLG